MARFTTEMRERAVQMLGEAWVDHPNQMAAMRPVAGLLGMSTETLRVWHRRFEIDAGSRPRPCFSPRNSIVPRRDNLLHRSDDGFIRGRGHLPGIAPGSSWVSQLSRVSRGQGSTSSGTPVA